MIEPKEVQYDGKTYVISKFPAIAGREIITQYPVTGAPVIGNYKANEELMLKVMSFVGVKLENVPIPLKLETKILIDNHVRTWETLMKLEKDMMVYNCSFFQNGRVSTFFDDIVRKLPMLVSQMWMALSESLSAKEKQLSANSEPHSV